MTPEQFAQLVDILTVTAQMVTFGVGAILGAVLAGT